MSIPRVHLESGFRQRERDHNNAVASQASTRRVTEFITIQGVGQLLFPVVFPVLFTELPGISTSFHLQEGQVQGDVFAGFDAGAQSWVSRELLPGSGSRYYSGATLILKTEGSDGQILVGHVHFEAMALVNPSTPSGFG